MRAGFDGGIKLEFHVSKVTSNSRLLTYRDLDYALGLFDTVSTSFIDKRTGRNVQHDMLTLMQTFRFQSGEDLVIRSDIQKVVCRDIVSN